MSYHTINTIANRVLKKKGLENVMTTANGFILFRFQHEEQLHSVLEQGPWVFRGKHLILQQWHPRFQFDANKIAKLPVWVRLKGLPLPLWSVKGLSLAASMVSKPLSCDQQTHGCTSWNMPEFVLKLMHPCPMSILLKLKVPPQKHVPLTPPKGSDNPHATLAIPPPPPQNRIQTKTGQDVSHGTSVCVGKKVVSFQSQSTTSEEDEDDDISSAAPPIKEKLIVPPMKTGSQKKRGKKRKEAKGF
ncbi:hypothetical protein OIU77_025040 [Salix suchowensis]|uniref:DUF4283 domain-containing protein n=1 Tax=Salix suchowensis TaxID=1278906 RepID=A0ABQ9BWZ4_9ROSI|nr:hypothetical protein OIU77_025040 [Salix suchowensis]